MPETIAVIGKILATKIIAGITVAAVVKTAICYAVSSMLTKSARSKAAGLGSGSDLVMTREPAPVRRIVYGETRVSGPMAFANISGEKNSTLCVAVLLAAHECEAVGAYLVDDEQVTPGTGGAVTTGTYANKLSMVSHLGDQTTADYLLMANAAGVWNYSHVLRGITYLAAKLTYDTDVYSGGLPNLSVILRGKRVYDPRTGLTAWSQNPALIVRDYLTNADYGLGCTADEIDDALIIAAANICDEDVALKAGGTEARYRCNGTFTTDAEPATIIETILSTMAGSITYSGGKFRVYAGAYSAPSVTLDENDMAGTIEFQPATGIREACNIVKGSFTSPADLYQPRDFPRFADASHITADGEEIATDLDLAWVSSPSQAQRLAKIYERKARLGGTVSLKCKLSAFRCQTGETIAVSNTRLGWSEKVFQVQEWRFAIGNDGTLGVELTCRETASSVYDWSASEEGILTTTSQFSNPPTTMQNVTGAVANPTPGTIDDLNGGTGAAPAGALLTQAQGGTCRISGCPPLDGVETYRRWRTQTASGTLRRYGWIGNTVCAYDPTGYNSWALSGTCLWTANDDTTVDNTMQYVDELSVTHAMAYGVVALPGYSYASQGTQTITATEIEYIGSSECIPDYGTPAASARSTGSEALTLSNEDTEDTAWTRMLALTSPSWATSETGTYSARTALTYLRQRYRYGYGSLDGDTIVATSGWTPWGVYEVKVQLQTHPVTAAGALTGDGAWSDLAQRTHLIQGDIDGKAKLDWQEEEPPRGYALRAVLTLVAPITS